MAKVRDRMTSPAVTQGPLATLGELNRVLESSRISAVPIVDSGKLVGIVSTTDLVRASAAGGGEQARMARDLMQAPVVTVAPDDSIEDAARRLVAARVHRVVVAEADAVVGVLSARDVLEEVRQRRVTEPISAIMTSPVETLDFGEPIDVAIERLAAANVHGLVVVDGTMPVGVFTHAEALAARRLPPALRRGPVEDVMSYETICLDASTPIYRAASYAVSMDVRRILAVDKRQVVGVLSCVDLVDVLARAT